MHILEAQDRPAKKILATGNGKCNYTNEKMALSCYRSAFISQAEEVLSQYPPSAAITYLKELAFGQVNAMAIIIRHLDRQHQLQNVF